MKNLLWKIFIWPFLNDEEPIPRVAAQWKKYQDKWGKHALLYWRLRNFLHNFTWNAVGVNDRDFEILGKDPTHTYALSGGWKFNIIKYKWWRLPYVSYINKTFKIRLGWANKGNLSFPFPRGTRPDNITW